MKSKILTATAMLKERRKLRARGRKLVFTNGCFDILHVGHVDYLSKARRLGDLLVIGLNTDSSVRKVKGKNRPINKESDRAKVLAALSSVDYVTLFSESTPEKLIMKLKPDVLVKGGDWKVKDIVGGDFVMKNGGKVKNIPYIKGYSTTSIIERSACRC